NLRAPDAQPRGKAFVATVGCLTARRRNDPKQAGLSISVPSDDGRQRTEDGFPSSVVCLLSSGWVLMMRAIKCLKGIRWMPWRCAAMKDVLRCDKPWGAAKKL